MKAIIATTNDIIIEGDCNFIGGATIAISVPELTAHKVEKLYELDVTARQYSNDWSVQIAKRLIKKIEFIDESRQIGLTAKKSDSARLREDIEVQKI